jgi:ABC-type transport system involved in multi-copper enzyme maturation permease subunit
MEKLEIESRENRGLWRERAPSLLREDEPTVARIVGTVGLAMALFGIMAIAVTAAGRQGPFGIGWGSFFLAWGLGGLLFHAAADKDLQIRRSYSLLGALLLIGGIVFSVIPFHEKTGGLFLLGFLCFVFALLFILAALRHETEELWRNRIVAVLGIAGAAAALTAFIGGNIRQGDFLYPYGVLLTLAGIFYLWAFVGLRGTSSDFAYRTGQAIGVLGAIVFLTAFVRSLFGGYLVPTGVILMCLGLLYLASSVAICSDRAFVVLTRRELTSFFYSPIAYIVLLGLACVAWVYFLIFLGQVLQGTTGRAMPMIEPIVQHYIFGFIPVVLLIFIVPILTMRLLSEEKRSGTLEVLLTAPVNEITVVLSKFLAALIFLVLAWLPWGMFLVALRIEDGKPFDYRPLLSFMIAMIFMGSGFVSMGLFFSSLTRNQIASSVLCFVGMILLTGLAIIKWNVEETSPTSAWVTVLGHISYVELWFRSLEGQLHPRSLIFHLSAAILWLFMTVKVLESRRWS